MTGWRKVERVPTAKRVDWDGPPTPDQAAWLRVNGSPPAATCRDADLAIHNIRNELGRHPPTPGQYARARRLGVDLDGFDGLDAAVRLDDVQHAKMRVRDFEVNARDESPVYRDVVEKLRTRRRA